MTKADILFKENIRRILYEGVFSENARPEILELAETVIGHHKDQSVIAYMEGL